MIFPLRYSPTSNAAGIEEVSIRFLGTAGFLIKSKDRTLLFDPYVSRPSVTEHTQRLIPNIDLIRREIIDQPQPDIREVFIGHAHSDHILDAPDVCRETGARLIGSLSTYRTGKAAGLSETQLVKIQKNREEVQCGNDIVVTAVQSIHAEAIKRRYQFFMRALNSIALRVIDHHLFERDKDENELCGIPFPGETEEDLEWPPHVSQLKCGQVYDWHVDINGLKIVHVDSADVLKGQFKDQNENLRADVVCLCSQGRDNSSKPDFDFTGEVLNTLKPKLVIPCHWDNFLRAYHKRPRAILGSKLSSWMRQMEEIGKGWNLKTCLVPFGGSVSLSKDIDEELQWIHQDI